MSRKSINLLMASALLVGCGTTAVFILPEANIIGTWEWEREGINCHESYTHNVDGTSYVESGEAQFWDEYKISSAANSAGRYKYEGVTVKQTIGKDCSGSIENYVGEPYTVYIHFETADRIRVYYSEKGDASFGPLERTR